MGAIKNLREGGVQNLLVLKVTEAPKFNGGKKKKKQRSNMVRGELAGNYL